jgi:hypothetical protein
VPPPVEASSPAPVAPPDGTATVPQPAADPSAAAATTIAARNARVTRGERARGTASKPPEAK